DPHRIGAAGHDRRFAASERLVVRPWRWDDRPAPHAPVASATEREREQGGSMISDTDFPRVVAAAGQGEEWALTALYRAYQPLLLRYLRAQEGDAGDDLASEAWIGVARGLARFQGDEDAFRCWLFTIARRRLIEFRRRHARRRTDAVAADRLDVVDVRGGLDPEVDVLDRLSAQSAVDEMVAALPREQAEVV